MKKVSFSPSKTSVKVYNPRPNDFCRVYRESIRISGRFQINLFGDKIKFSFAVLEALLDTNDR